MQVEYIDQMELLEKVCEEELLTTSQIAVDLEFDKNRYRYGFNLCLVQVATEERAFLIDPLEDDLQLDPLFAVFENPDIQKIVFEFGEDIRLLHSLNCRPQNVFDVSYASKLLDNPQLSLNNVLEIYCGLQLDKTSQNSNWFKRPLSDKQKSYAVADVEHLIELQRLTEQKLDVERLNWVKEENKWLESQDHSQTQSYDDISQKYFKGLTEWEYDVFDGLLMLRNERARKKNRPTYQIIRTDDLLQVVESIQSNNIQRLQQIERSSQFKGMISQAMNLAKQADADKRSKQRSYLPQMTAEERQFRSKQRARQQSFIDHVLKPIQGVIKEEYGENVATFLLSNKNMKQISINGFSSVPSYRSELFLVIANRLKLDQPLHDYLGLINS